MGQIHFPPRGLFENKIVPFSVCLEWNDDDVTISFGVSGVFECLTPGCINPEPPKGNYGANTTIGPFVAIGHDATAILNFYDPQAQILYVATVQIQQACSDTKPKKKPKKS